MAQYPSIKLNNELSMPSFGLGTWLSPQGEVGAAIKIALNAGYKHIDCASAYCNEVEAGQAFSEYFAQPGAAKREDIFIVSKLWVKDFKRVKEACKKTLKELQLGYLDLYLIHLPYEVDQNISTVVPQGGVGLIGYSPERINEVWKDMEQLVEEGLVKSIGISNFTCKKIDALLASSPKIVPVTNQVELHPYLPQNQLLKHCTEKGITLTAYSPLGGPGRPSIIKADDEPFLLEDKAVKSVADKHKVTAAQVLMMWSIKRGIPVIPKSTNEKRIHENLACLSVNLDNEDMATLSGIQTRYRYIKQRWAIKPGDALDSIWDGEYLA